MKKRKIISAAAAVMMAAVTLAPQLPSAFPAARICTPITAEAAKNEVRIKVVDMATDMPIENVDVAASVVKDFSREEGNNPSSLFLCLFLNLAVFWQFFIFHCSANCQFGSFFLTVFSL